MKSDGKLEFPIRKLPVLINFQQKIPFPIGNTAPIELLENPIG